MYRLMVESGFASAHQLREYQGKCEALHGHNWRVQVMVKTEKLNAIGLGLDFHTLKAKLKETISPLDHTYLNDKEPFNRINPSSENLARYIFDQLLSLLDTYAIQLEWVRVWESDTTFAQYSLE